MKSSDILKRGMSLVKSYSKMSEEERKELIKKAFEAKKKLEDELEKTKEEVKKKSQEVEKLNKQVFKSGIFFVLFYSRYWVIFPIENSIFFPNPQEKIPNCKLKNIKFE